MWRLLIYINVLRGFKWKIVCLVAEGCLPNLPRADLARVPLAPSSNPGMSPMAYVCTTPTFNNVRSSDSRIRADMMLLFIAGKVTGTCITGKDGCEIKYLLL